MENKTTTAYQPLSNSVIHLHFKELPSDTLYLESFFVSNIPLDVRRSEKLVVTSEGDYFLNLEVDRPNIAMVAINQDKSNIIVYPEDTTHVVINSGKEGQHLSFTGKGAEINEYYKKKEQFLQYQDIRFPLNQFFTTNATYNSIKDGTDSVASNELLFLEEYPDKDKLPDWFLSLEESEIRYQTAAFLIEIPKVNSVFNRFKDSVPHDYFNFLNDVKVNNPEGVLSGNYFRFLDVYFSRDAPYDSVKGLAGFSKRNAINHVILTESATALTEEVKNVYYKYLLSTSIPYYSDSSEIDSLARAYGVADYQDLLSFSGQKSKNGLSQLQLVTGDTIPNFYVTDAKDSLVSIRDFQDKVVYINFWATWCAPCLQNIPELNKLILEVDNQEVVFLNICIESPKEKWQPTIMSHQLEGINVFAEGNWSKKLAGYFNIRGIPQYVLIDKENILFENHTDKAPVIKSKINQLLEVNATKPK